MKLFQPCRMGEIMLENRIVMAPLTRSRATAGTDAPNDLNVKYYAQRATAGLIISEASQISPQGKGYPWTPGIYSDVQVSGWNKVTEAVHENGGKIFIQLWHVGRISHPSLQRNGALPVAPSAIRLAGQAFTESGMRNFVTPRALDIEEIPGIIGQYENAAENAKKAGFDGVEIHAANGYLLDQFLREGSNKRTDIYGGSVENRIRLTLEAVEAAASVFGKKRTGIRLSPVSSVNNMHDSDPASLFSRLLEKLNDAGIAYVHMIEGITRGSRDIPGFDFDSVKKLFSGTYIANNGYDRELAISAVESSHADLIAFGRPFISNPDL
ncbi:MAG TPA: alkene reductase, partial [Burkholderiales bacterium]|nr:alkene reductase [Burkholderiales bacterium]